MVNNDDDNSPTFHPLYRNAPRGGRGRGRGKRRGFARGNKRTSLTPNESPNKFHHDNIVWTTPERLKLPINRRKSRGGPSRITSTPLQIFEEDTRMSGDLGPFHLGR